MSKLKHYVESILDGADLVIVDVGAAYGLPPHLTVFESSARICLFEPDPARARELMRHYGEDRGFANVTVFAEALAGGEEERTLYVTNVPTGSSLLSPGGPIIAEFGNQNYFFPLREVTVRTRALADVLNRASIPRSDAVKLDVQGAELEVLRGLRGMLPETTLAVELEVGFPGAYLEQPGFGAVEQFMVAAGFRLYDMRLVRHHRSMNGDPNYYPSGVFGVSTDSPSLSKRIAEADALYFRRPDLILQRRDVATIRRLIALMCAYGQFIEAYDLIGRAQETAIITPAGAQSCRDAVVGWHHMTKDLCMDATWFARLSVQASRVYKGLQRRLLGKRFMRWQE